MQGLAGIPNTVDMLGDGDWLWVEVLVDGLQAVFKSWPGGSAKTFELCAFGVSWRADCGALMKIVKEDFLASYSGEAGGLSDFFCFGAGYIKSVWQKLATAGVDVFECEVDIKTWCIWRSGGT